MIQLNSKNHEELLHKFESWTEVPMLLLVLLMIVTLVLPVVVHLTPQTFLTLELVDWTIWALFALELGIRTFLAPKKLAYLRRNWVDVLVVVLPVLRIFRIFRLARIFETLRIARIATLFGKFSKEIKTVLYRHHLHYLLVILIGATVIGSVLIYNFDKNMGQANENYADALWLAVVNVFSGGFENVFPATPESRGISILLILFGTIVVSYFTASLAAYFTEKEEDVEQARIEKKLDVLIEEVKKLKKNEEVKKITRNN